MGDVIFFPGTEEATSFLSVDDEQPLDPELVLEGAKQAILKDLIVLGRSVEDDTFYFAGTSNNVGKMLLLLEMAKKTLVDAVE